MSDNYESLSDELKVAMKIYSMELNGHDTFYKTIVKEFGGYIPAKIILAALNNLIDVGTVNAEWEKISNDEWDKKFFITPESNSFIRCLVDTIGEATP